MSVTESAWQRVPDMMDWSQLVQKHGPVVWRTVYRLLGNEADASDCFQNTFVSAVQLSRTQAVRNWPGLLRRMATTSALERLRRRYRESGRLTAFSDGSALDAIEVEPAQAAQDSEFAEDLRVALTRLDERQAHVFCLACVEDLSYREIAGQIGVTVNHVGVLLNRAKSRLRELLRPHGPVSGNERFERETQP